MKNKLLIVALAACCTVTLAACTKTTEEVVNENVQIEESVDQVVSNEKEEIQTEEKEVETKETEETNTIVEEPTENSIEGDFTEIAVNTPSELATNWESFQVSIDGIVYQFPMMYSDFKALGWTCKTESQNVPSNSYTFATWTKGDMKVSTDILNLAMNEKGFEECMVAGISIEKYSVGDLNNKIVLPGGITYNQSNADDIKAVYGEPTSDFSSDLYYNMTYKYDYNQELELYVYNDSNVIKTVIIRNFIELEGLDNSIDSSVPDAVKAYKKPTELGTDLYSFNCEIDGNLYNFPCPVTEFLNNGFSLVADKSAEAVAGGGSGWIVLRKNNQSVKFLVSNFAPYATIPENCFICDFEVSEVKNNTFKIVLPKGITIGMSKEELLKNIEGYNYKVTETKYGEYYAIYKEGTSGIDGCAISVEDNKVDSIDIERGENIYK